MGQIGANLGNSNVTDPQQANWGDLDSNEKGARVLAGLGRGALNGYSNYQQQNAQLRQGGGGVPYVPTPQTPAINFQSTNFTPAQQRSRNPYFYGYGEGGQ